MIEFNTLETTAIEEIANTFNSAFSDYLIPLKLTSDQLQDKIISESIDLKISVGAFREKELVGFILHGYRFVNDRPIAYNAGTGVAPSARGQKLTCSMYEFIVPKLRNINVDITRLEVLTENHIAFKTYEKIGFEISRTFNCYRGSLKVIPKAKDYRITAVEDLDWNLIETFWEYKPSWQNEVVSIENLHDQHIRLAAFDEAELLGYLIFHPGINRIKQFAVKPEHRRKSVATELFNHLARKYSKDVVLINIDEKSYSANKFLENLGLSKFLMQYEMNMPV